MASMRNVRSDESVLDEIFHDSGSEMELIDDSDWDENFNSKSSSSESESDEVSGDGHATVEVDTDTFKGIDLNFTRIGQS